MQRVESIEGDSTLFSLSLRLEIDWKLTGDGEHQLKKF